MKNIRVSVKLIASYLLIAAIAVAVGIYQVVQLQNNDTAYTKQLYEQVTVPMGDLIPLTRAFQMVRIAAHDIPAAHDAAERRALGMQGDSLIDFVKEGYEKQRPNVATEVNKKRIDDIKNAADNYLNLANAWVAEIDQGKAALDPDTHLPSIPENMNVASAKMGQLIDAFVAQEVKSGDEISDALTESMLATRNISITILVIMFVVALGCGIYMTRSITGPLTAAVTAIAKGEQGDMTARVDLHQQDEFGQMADSVNKFFAKLQGMIGHLKQNSETLAGSSEELSAVSRQLASSSEETVNQSNAGASAAEEASVNASEVAGAAEQMSTNMNTVAAAVEELSASISNIANSADQAREVSSQATTKAAEATDVMGKLGEAAKNIGQVTNAIKSIADKTNLLALNATIEAASAGEAGKGFAVVANEIKELANQSAKSADDIAQRIDGMQTGTNQAVGVIGSVSSIIGDINQSVTAIAGHVEQQTKAVNEIASNVSQASTGAKRVAAAIGEVAKGAKDISQSIGMVSQAAQQSAQGAGQVNQSAGDLSKMAGELKATTNQFKV